MRPTSELRMPLQVGVMTSQSMLRAFVNIGLALVILVLGMTAFLSMGEDGSSIPRLVMPLPEALLPFSVFALLAGVVAVPVLAGLGIVHLWRVLKNPPTDMVLGPAGIRVVGQGCAYRWEEVVTAGCEVVVTEELALTLGNVLRRAHNSIQDVGGDGSLEQSESERHEETPVVVGRFMLPLVDGDVVSLARAEDPIEVESLEALCRTVKAVDRTPGLDTGPQGGAGARILACPECSAAVGPQDEDSVTCAHCGARVAMPEALRDMIRATHRGAAERAGTEQAVRDLVRQPGAETTRRLVLAATGLLAVAWAVSVSAMAASWRLDALTLPGLALVLGSPFAFTWGVYYLVRAHLVSRGALRLVSLRFGARPPDREGEPHGCRNCGAPLAAGPADVLVRCLYCGMDSVLTFDLRRDFPSGGEVPMDLGEVFAQRREERKQHFVRAGTTLAAWAMGSLGAGIAIVWGLATR